MGLETLSAGWDVDVSVYCRRSEESFGSCSCSRDAPSGVKVESVRFVPHAFHFTPKTIQLLGGRTMWSTETEPPKGT
jgi:hypothetical protein